MAEKIILSGEKFSLVLRRLAYQIIEENGNIENIVIVGIQPRGVTLAKKIHTILQGELSYKNIPFGVLDPTLYRDDWCNNNIIVANNSKLDIAIKDKRVILIDDVLYTGRTARAAIESLISYGRPSKIELLCLVDRRFKRDLPITSNYTGIQVDTISSQKVIVDISEDQNSVSLI